MAFLSCFTSIFPPFFWTTHLLFLLLSFLLSFISRATNPPLPKLLCFFFASIYPFSALLLPYLLCFLCLLISIFHPLSFFPFSSFYFVSFPSTLKTHFLLSPPLLFCQKNSPFTCLCHHFPSFILCSFPAPILLKLFFLSSLFHIFSASSPLSNSSVWFVVAIAAVC